MALRRRRVRMATSQQPCRMTMKFMRCPITFTAIRKQIWGPQSGEEEMRMKDGRSW